MAQQIRLIDDIDKDTEAAGTVEFSFGGKDYAIDLSAENMEAFTDQMAYWIEHARKAGKPPATVHTTQATTAVKQVRGGTVPEWSNPPGAGYIERNEYKDMRQEARKWAIENGWPDLGQIGRLPDDVYPAWKEAMGWKGNLYACWSTHKRRISRNNNGHLTST